MNFIKEIANYITRPTRQRYHINRLGPKQIILRFPYNFQSLVFRDDYEVINFKGRKIVFSFYMNQLAQQQHLCVVYLHANNGSRVQGLHYLQSLLENKFNVCLLDFSGSGSSQGDYITLGPNQTQDLACVFHQLYKKKGITKMVLWGRSMGACTALMYAHKYPNNVAAMILDSPFKDLRALVKQSASDKTGIPQFIFEPILKFVDDQLENRIGHRFSQYQMRRYILGNSKYPETNRKPIIPAIFIASKLDNLVKAHHVQDLYNIYPGKNNQNKFLHYISNQHHEDRDKNIIDKCIKFINSCLNNKEVVQPQYIPDLTYVSQPTIPSGRTQSTQRNTVQSAKFSFKSQNVIQLEQPPRQKQQPYLYVFNKFLMNDEKKYIKGVNLTNSIDLGQADSYQQRSISKRKNNNSRKNLSHKVNKINLSNNKINQSFQSYSLSNHPAYLNSSADLIQHKPKMVQSYSMKPGNLSLQPQSRPILPPPIRNSHPVNVYINNQNWNANVPRNYPPHLSNLYNYPSTTSQQMKRQHIEAGVQKNIYSMPYQQKITERKTHRQTYKPSVRQQNLYKKENSSSRSLKFNTNKISLSKINLNSQKIGY